MPNGDGTGPDGNGPKKKNKGWPEKNGQGKCRWQNQGMKGNRNFQSNKQGRRGR